jgi:hypothetical protein
VYILCFQHVTYHLIRRSIFSLWAGVLLLVSLPLFGFGRYYSPGPPLRCERYRQATDPVGTAYAYLYFAFGESGTCDSSLTCSTFVYAPHSQITLPCVQRLLIIRTLFFILDA